MVIIPKNRDGDILVHVHMPKTGGTWVRNISYKLFGRKGVRVRTRPDHEMGRSQHAPAHSILPDLQGGHFNDGTPFGEVTVLGTIRDPWSWYASWYVHAITKSPGKLTCPIFDYFAYERNTVGVPTFKEVLRGLTHPPEGNPWKEPTPFFNPWGTSNSLPDNHQSIGFYSSNVLYTYKSLDTKEWLVDQFIDTSNLSRVFPALLDFDLEEEVDFSHKANVNKYSYLNAEGPWDLYDEESMAWVQEADCRIIEQMQFTPFQPTKVTKP